MKSNSVKRIGLQFFSMKNLDAVQRDRTEILQRMTQAVQANDQEKFMQAFGDLADAIGESILGDVQVLQSAQDSSILAARGCQVLTSEERQYYEAVIGAMKADDPKQALTNVKTVLPETVIDAVFNDLTASHPLLSEIDFQNTGALVKILLSTTVAQSAAVPAGKAVMGLPAKYFMGLGTQSGGKIEYSDEYKFLERQRIYAIFLYGYGRAMDENAFILLDISGLHGAALEVQVISRSAAAPDEITAEE